MKKITSILVLFVLVFTMAMPAMAADKMSAISITLTKIDGDGATVTDKMGRELSLKDGARIVSGYTITTDSKTTVYLALDNKTSIAIEKNSVVTINKKGSKNEVYLESGEIAANVSEKLAGSEELNIATSNMVMGVRGTTVSVTKRITRTVDENGNAVDSTVTKGVVYTGETEIKAVGETLPVSGGFMIVIGEVQSEGEDGDEPSTETEVVTLMIDSEDVSSSIADFVENDSELSEEIANRLNITTGELDELLGDLATALEEAEAEKAAAADDLKKTAEDEKTVANVNRDTPPADDDDTPAPIPTPTPMTQEQFDSLLATYSQSGGTIDLAGATVGLSSNVNIAAGKNVTISGGTLEVTESRTVTGSLTLDCTVNLAENVTMTYGS